VVDNRLKLRAACMSWEGDFKAAHAAVRIPSHASLHRADANLQKKGALKSFTVTAAGSFNLNPSSVVFKKHIHPPAAAPAPRTIIIIGGSIMPRACLPALSPRFFHAKSIRIASSLFF